MTYDEQVKELVRLKREANSMKLGTPEFKSHLQKIDKLTIEVRDAERGLADNRRQIGNYRR